MEATFQQAQALAELLQRGSQLANVLALLVPQLQAQHRELLAGELAAYDQAALAFQQLGQRPARPPSVGTDELTTDDRQSTTVQRSAFRPTPRPCEAELEHRVSDLLAFLRRAGHPQPCSKIARELKLTRPQVLGLLRRAKCQTIQHKLAGPGSRLYTLPLSESA